MRTAVLGAIVLAACRAPQAPEAGRPVAGTDLVVVPPPAAVRANTAEVGFPDGSRLRVSVAATPEARERGLMFRETLGPDEGMLFVFDAEQSLGFWMKNTFVDLDMLWLDTGGRVTTLHERVPRSQRGMRDDAVASRSGWGRFVLELAAGQAGRRKVVRGSVLSLDLSPGAP